MQPFTTLCILSILMGLGSFASGYIPLSLSIPQEKLVLLTTFGSGLLVGTALTVIIPEGVATLYMSTIGGQKLETLTLDHLPQQMLGFSLLFGFAFMFLVEQFGEAHQSHSQISVAELSDVDLRSSPKSSVALGLLIHSAADGVALGAASLAGSSTSTEFIVFLAILLHKAPAAFGLSSFLLQSGMPRRGIRHQLILFSMAAPLTALLTHIIIGAFHVGSASVMSYFAGTLLLFSAGTFLYVSTTTILPEIYRDQKRLCWNQLLSIFIGFFLPWILSGSFGVSF